MASRTPATSSPDPSRRSVRRRSPASTTATTDTSSQPAGAGPGHGVHDGQHVGELHEGGVVHDGDHCRARRKLAGSSSSPTAGSSSGAAPASATVTESSRSDTSCSWAVRTADWKTPGELVAADDALRSARQRPAGRRCRGRCRWRTGRPAARPASSLTSSWARASVAVVGERLGVGQGAARPPGDEPHPARATSPGRPWNHEEPTGSATRRDIRRRFDPASCPGPAGEERERPTMRH